jgi:hypothetical protein
LTWRKRKERFFVKSLAGRVSETAPYLHESPLAYYEIEFATVTSKLNRGYHDGTAGYKNALLASHAPLPEMQRAVGNSSGFFR